MFGWRTRYWSFLLKLAKDQPSWTIQAQPGSAIGPFHWTNRKLSVAEMCRLQTFPDGLAFDLEGPTRKGSLGNAVPSVLAEVLAREIRAQLLDRPLKSTTLKLLPREASPCASPQKNPSRSRKVPEPNRRPRRSSGRGQGPGRFQKGALYP